MQLRDFAHHHLTAAILVREDRHQKDISLEAYGARFGVTKQSVWAWERGLTEPSAVVLIAIVGALVRAELVEGGPDA